MSVRILSIGEVLWDSLPGGLFPGGAPFNVACHLHSLGNNVTMISRVGDDELGRQIVRRMDERKMDSKSIQVDPDHATGIVNVTLSADGIPDYDIVQPSSWDFISADPELLKLAKMSQVLIFGSLAQRSEQSRQTIKTLRKLAKKNVFDINLRHPHTDKDIVRESLQDAHIIKLNDEEILQLAEWFSWPADIKQAAVALSVQFECETVCVTKGENGAALWHQQQWTEHPGFKITPIDTVGTGDAFLAGLISGILSGMEAELVLTRANAIGAYVATKNGATPPIDEANLPA